jgi:hypothetical protein
MLITLLALALAAIQPASQAVAWRGWHFSRRISTADSGSLRRLAGAATRVELQEEVPLTLTLTAQRR